MPPDGAEVSLHDGVHPHSTHHAFSGCLHEFAVAFMAVRRHARHDDVAWRISSSVLGLPSPKLMCQTSFFVFLDNFVILFLDFGHKKRETWMPPTRRGVCAARFSHPQKCAEGLVRGTMSAATPHHLVTFTEELNDFVSSQFQIWQLQTNSTSTTHMISLRWLRPREISASPLSPVSFAAGILFSFFLARCVYEVAMRRLCWHF